MVPPDGAEQPLFAEFRKILPEGMELRKIQRFAFYDKSREPDTAPVAATGDERDWAILLLTMGYNQ